MKAALLGYGQMGQLIEKLSGANQVEIVEKYWDEHVLKIDEINQSKLQDVEVLIDFSVPAAAAENIHKGIALNKQIVIGTTGWFDQLEQIREKVLEKNLGLVYASNFSLGVNLFYKLAEYAASKISVFKDYDPFIEESHHQFKKDAPSGTAIEIKKIAESASGGGEIPVTSVRAGYIPGSHSLSFDSPVDTIRLSHVARNREGFATGALIAAKWIVGKKGVFHFRDVLEDILCENNNKNL